MLARIHCDGMRELIANNPAHWKDEQALDLIRSLCRRAREVISDRASRAYLSAIDDYAAALLPGGVLITGGFTTDGVAEVDLALTRAGFAAIDRQVVGDYVGLAHRRTEAR